MTIEFATDAQIDSAADIVITLPDGFVVADAVVADGTDIAGVKVNGADDTTTASSTDPTDGVVTITVKVAVVIPVDDPLTLTITETEANVSIVIPSGIITTPDTDGDYTISVNPDSTGAVTEVVTFANPPGSIDVIPNKPNKSDNVVFSFTPDADIAVEDYIVLILQEKFFIPDAGISASDVKITSAGLNDGAKSAGGSIGIETETVFKADKDDHLIFIQVPDMDTSDTGTDAANLDDLPRNRKVTVTILKAAGIKAPTEAGTHKVAVYVHNEEGVLGVKNAKDAVAYDGAVQTDKFAAYKEQVLNRLITLSDEDGGRGDQVTATAKGWGGDKVTFFVDSNGNGMHDEASEALLCAGDDGTAEQDNSGNIGECTFTLGSEFVGGHGTGCDGENEPGLPLVEKCNLINAFDSEGAYSVINWEDDVIEISTSINLSPAEGNPGEEIVVQIRDFPANTAVSSIKIAGADDELSANERTDQNGDASITIEIPNVTSGTRVLTVVVGTGPAEVDDDTNISIGGATLLASPTSVIPNQRINISASGFDRNATITSFSIGGYNMGTAGLDLEKRSVDSGGNWNGSINIPYVQTTVGGGNLSLVVTDNTTRSGSTTLNFRERVVTLTPAQGRVGSTITVTGENFPGLNGDTETTIDVDILYDGARKDSVEPDVSGRWQSIIQVPRNEDIPSTNVIRVEFGREGTDQFKETETFLHNIPRATISLSPASGPEGSMATLTGQGFHRFQAIESLDVGGNSALPSPAPSTNREGDIELTFQIPGVESGSQTVIIKINEVTAGAAYNVTDASGVVGAVTSDVDTALEPLLTAGTLDRVFYFNNATKEWQWHIVDPDFASTNNLDDVVSGAPLWVLVTEDTSAVLNNRTVDFTCAGGDCWNLVTFP